MTVTTVRRTQAERSATTQRRLLDATVACLVELGYGGTTTSAVSQRAGVSRGAQLHHYGSRQLLMGAAVQHLAARRLEWVQENAAKLPQDASRPRRTLELLAEALSGPLYAATLELYVAARVDHALHEALVPVERQVTKELRRLCREYVTPDPVLLQLTLDLLLGRGVGSLLSPVRPGHQRKLLDVWADVVAARVRP